MSPVSVPTPQEYRWSPFTFWVARSVLCTDETWDLVPSPPSKITVDCWWIYIIKVGSHEQVDRLLADLVVKSYIQIYGHEHGYPFCPVAKMSFVWLFLSMTVVRHWPFYQLDIKNVFLYGDLKERVYMKQLPSFVKVFDLVCKLCHSLHGLNNLLEYCTLCSSALTFKYLKCFRMNLINFFH